MRLPLLAVCLALGAVIAAPSSAQSPANAPKRKPGAWEMKLAMAELGGLTQTLQMCVGANTDDDLLQQNGRKSNCSSQHWQRDGDRISFSAVCQVEGSTANIRGSFSGDFDNRYSGELHSTYTPPLQGMATMTVRHEGRWLGPCAAGQRAGDVVMQGVGGVNVEQLLKGLPRR